ncbi:MAG: hypothetical protein ACUZ8O_07395 [Candidatus Anammoxibacter sp.]
MPEKENMTKRIEGKISKILDEYNVVINKGIDDGITEKMPFVIFSISSSDEIKDPDTQESLGKLELVKGYVTAVHVQERVTICAAEKRNETKDGDTGTGAQTLSGAMIAECMGKKGERFTERMNVNTAQISGMPEVGPISVGDCVRSLL